MNALDELRRTRTLLSDPTHWCKGSHSRQRADGGYEYCLVGGLHFDIAIVADVSEEGMDIRNTADEALHQAAEELGLLNTYESLIHFNDMNSTTHSEVLAVIDLAITRMEVAQ
jgi:hypothetical protein